MNERQTAALARIKATRNRPGLRPVMGAVDRAKMQAATARSRSECEASAKADAEATEAAMVGLFRSSAIGRASFTASQRQSLQHLKRRYPEAWAKAEQAGPLTINASASWGPTVERVNDSLDPTRVYARWNGKDHNPTLDPAKIFERFNGKG